MTCAEPSEFTKDSAPPPPLVGRTSVTAGWSRSHLFFEDDEGRFDKVSVLAASDFYAGKWTITLGAGGVVTGELQEPGGDWDVGPGWVAAASVSWRVLADEKALPYVVLSATFAGTGARLERRDDNGNYIGIDFRFGGTVGKTFFGWLSPYAALRVFGGPIFVFTETDMPVGTDRFHVQGAGGVVFILPENLDLFVEGSPGGEQGAFGGVGWRY